MIHREYQKYDLLAITSGLRGHLPILCNKNPNVNIGGKGCGKKFMNFIFASELTLTLISMTNQTQLSKKHWRWQLYCTSFMALKIKKNRFSSFNE